MVALVGLLARLSCKSRQVRKEATVAADACAGEPLARAAAFVACRHRAPPPRSLKPAARIRRPSSSRPQREIRLLNPSSQPKPEISFHQPSFCPVATRQQPSIRRPSPANPNELHANLHGTQPPQSMKRAARIGPIRPPQSKASKRVPRSSPLLAAGPRVGVRRALIHPCLTRRLERAYRSRLDASQIQRFASE